jgi:hypothetical protein
MAKRRIGDIFYSGDFPGTPQDASHSYWKITAAAPKPGWISTQDSYLVIKCSKYGKEYSTRNGFLVRQVDAIPEDKIINTALGVKADIQEGARIGQMKRRVVFLEKRIKDDHMELGLLLSKLQAVVIKP